MLRMLEAVGVTQDEERVYLALLRERWADATDLGKSLGMPEEQVAEALAGLAAKGLVTRAAGDGPVVAARPDLAVEALVARRYAELQEARIAGSRLLEEYRSATRDLAANELVEIIVGDDAVAQRFTQLQHDVRREVLVFVKSTDTPLFGDPRNGAFRLLQGGVARRALYARDALDTPNVLERITAFTDAGGEARTGPVPADLAILDRQVALVPLLSGESGDGDPVPGRERSFLLIRRCGLLDVLVSLFDLLWLRAAPLRTRPGIPGPRGEGGESLSALDTQLLSLLLAGLTDHVIARQLGLSLRTVQRRVRDLMTLAGVDTRVQLGWQAARRGWLTGNSALEERRRA
ncbi:Transcriptional regulator [Carbonactinospora thermoautotrophica]|uniref:Transcriptional regulator n=2 Tax=Carbonactinospora thermoautotrophica TaxID=1469144 RepID=A0A132MPU6_9ACTN|nr:Transcriptional regulator [Carbonactinospora thermoautotrophica]